MMVKVVRDEVKSVRVLQFGSGSLLWEGLRPTPIPLWSAAEGEGAVEAGKWALIRCALPALIALFVLVLSL